MIATKPPTVDQSTDEDIVWGVDMAAQLTGAQTVTLPVAELIGPTGTVVTLVDAPTVDGTVIRQRIRGGTLSPGRWRLVVGFTPSGTTNFLESTLLIVCRT